MDGKECDMENEKKVLTVEELAKELRISKSLAYRQVREGKIYSIKCGDRYLIPKKAFEQLLFGNHQR
jgi:excisionase family DNA binding protein